MNKAELKAISTIADKLNWKNKPVMEVCETINQMVRNQQALELDTIGECDDEEETLLSIALWDANKIASTMIVSDYQSLIAWNNGEFLYMGGTIMYVGPQTSVAMVSMIKL